MKMKMENLGTEYERVVMTGIASGIDVILPRHTPHVRHFHQIHQAGRHVMQLIASPPEGHGGYHRQQLSSPAFV